MLTGLIWPGTGPAVRCCEYEHEPAGSVKRGKLARMFTNQKILFG